jgi:hypothetical protein
VAGDVAFGFGFDALRPFSPRADGVSDIEVRLPL